LEKKTVEITGFGGREKALQVVNQSILDYNEKFGK
jgi:inorganic pyrophosphatase